MGKAVGGQGVIDPSWPPFTRDSVLYASDAGSFQKDSFLNHIYVYGSVCMCVCAHVYLHTSILVRRECQAPWS